MADEDKEPGFVYVQELTKTLITDLHRFTRLQREMYDLIRQVNDSLLLNKRSTDKLTDVMADMLEEMRLQRGDREKPSVPRTTTVRVNGNGNGSEH